ncbi:unnamed protein product [Moneuplotes crassus]|uniref:Uncharacterized protein n=1 Tax=Euplotes crassus TaxID=5936 RepID=A0AAD1XAM4_EUPCR|nr:unnamed protein product [Moneuplotes crassus]
MRILIRFMYQKLRFTRKTIQKDRLCRRRFPRDIYIEGRNRKIEELILRFSTSQKEAKPGIFETYFQNHCKIREKKAPPKPTLAQKTPLKRPELPSHPSIHTNINTSFPVLKKEIEKRKLKESRSSTKSPLRTGSFSKISRLKKSEMNQDLECLNEENSRTFVINEENPTLVLNPKIKSKYEAYFSNSTSLKIGGQNNKRYNSNFSKSPHKRRPQGVSKEAILEKNTSYGDQSVLKRKLNKLELDKIDTSLVKLPRIKDQNPSRKSPYVKMESRRMKKNYESIETSKVSRFRYFSHQSQGLLSIQGISYPGGSQKAQEMSFICTTIQIVPIDQRHRSLKEEEAELLTACGCTLESRVIRSRLRIKFKYIIVKGNNSGLIREALKTRPQWMEIPNIHSMYNFKWQPFSNGINFGSLGRKAGIKQIVNHLKKHKAISNKVCLLDTLSKYFGPDLFQYVPVTMSVAVKPGDSMKSLNEALKPFLRIFEMFGEACEGVKEVWRRGGGNEGVEMWNEENQKGGDSPNQKSPDYCMPLSHFSGNNFWVFKVSDLNRGRGIHIFNTAQQLLDLVKAYGIHRVDKAKNHMNIFTHSKLQNDFIIYPNNKLIPELNTGLLMTNSKLNEQHKPGCKNQRLESIYSAKSNLRERIGRNVTSDYNFIIQKYIERPFLIHGRKFDIRVWVLVSHTGKCYFFKEGYLRTSTTKFSMDESNPDDPHVHLTNNAIQKSLKGYGKFEDGNQLSFKQFQEYLDSLERCSINFKRDCLPQIKNSIMHTLLAAREQLSDNKNRLGFEFFGFDFMLDEDFNAWLIEVNTNPCIEESSEMLKHYLRRLIDDMLKLELDPFFPRETT